MKMTVLGLSVGDTITAPTPFSGTAEIVGFRYHTSRNTGRTCMVADYVTHDGKASFDPVEKLRPLKISEAPKADTGPSASNIREFCGYLRNCTDAQVRGVYEKEKHAGREVYATLAEVEGERRGLIFFD